jgi:hypothetical protein
MHIGYIHYTATHTLRQSTKPIQFLTKFRLLVKEHAGQGRPAQRAFTEPNKNGLFREARVLQEMHGLHVTVR